MQNLHPKLPPLSFDENLRAFLERDLTVIPLKVVAAIPGQGKGRRWLEETAENLSDVLRKLHRRHSIPPAPVLLILCRTYTRFILTNPLPRSLATNKSRETDAKILQAAACLIRSYQRNDLLNPLSAGQVIEVLDGLAQQVGTFQPKKAQKEELRHGVQALADFFKKTSGIGEPLYENIGNLIKTAFPQWRADAGHDLKKAAKELAKGPRDVDVRYTLHLALAMQLDMQYKQADTWKNSVWVPNRIERSTRGGHPPH